MDITTLYGHVTSVFDAKATPVDVQTDFMERLEIAAVSTGLKPAFFAITQDPERRDLFATLSSVLPASAGRRDFAQATVHTRYRDLRLPIEVVELVDVSAKSNVPIFWLTKDDQLAERFGRDQLDNIDHEIAGYPKCCAAWHYDTFFARPLEAFWEVYSFRSEADRHDYLSGEWQQTPGWFLPRSHFLIGIYRSNLTYPFIPHFACPRCLASPNSESALQNHAYSSLGLSLDPDRHGAVLDWAEDKKGLLSRLISDARQDAAREAYAHGFDGKDQDDYLRHSRYLLKAIGVG